mmetsp:Transcript_93/g.97  ORF Transcript_93/g.97 Transcript_93/m.97 type:complete len:99 (-) Transcript_93:82-378(-)
MAKLPYLKSATNKDRVDHSPKVTVDGKVVTVFLQGSSKKLISNNNKCTFTHIFVLESITNGVSGLNKWALGTDGVKWSSKNRSNSSKSKTKDSERRSR